MSKTLKNIVTYTLVFVATSFLVWFSFNEIKPPEGLSKWEFLQETLRSANKTFLFLSGLVAVLSHVVRAERWRLMLAPIGYPVSLLRSFFSVMVGYFVNLAIPRGGEVARCLNMFRLGKVPVETSLGTVVAERIIDVFFLLAFILASFLLQYKKLIGIIKEFLRQREALKNTSTSFPLIWVVLSGVVFFIAVLVILKKMGKLDGLATKLAGMWTNLRKGLLAVFSLERKRLFLFYSALIWVLYFVMAWFVMLAFEETSVLGIEATLTVFTLGSIAMAIPTPGGAGSYHILVPLGLNLLYGLTEASAFTFIFHAWQTLVIILVGLVAFVVSQLLKPSPNKNESGG